MIGEVSSHTIFTKMPDGSLKYPKLANCYQKTNGWAREKINDGAGYIIPCLLDGAKRTELSLMQQLFNNRAEGFLSIYQYAFNINVLSEKDIILQPMGGFAPNGLPHIGHLLHISALRELGLEVLRLASFNDFEARFVRGASNDEIINNAYHFIALFTLHFGEKFQYELRTQVPELMDLYLRLCDPNFITSQDYINVFGHDDLTDQQKGSLLIQTAAYLWRSEKDKRIIPVGFNGIEEMKRMKWINYVAKNKLGLRGGLFFISPQIPGWNSELKMGKSNPEGSLKLGDNLANTLDKIAFLSDTYDNRYLLIMLQFLFDSSMTKLSDMTSNLEDLKVATMDAIIKKHDQVFRLNIES